MNDQMKYNPNIHHRRSVRLQGYDYSKAGLYFITICCKDRICRLGVIENHKMILNDIGNIADTFWQAIPEHFPQVVLHEHIVMPNHVHGIIELTNIVTSHDVWPRHGEAQPDQTDDPVGTRHGVSLQGDTNPIDRTCHGMSQPQPHGMSQPQPRITNQPKSNQFGKPIAGSVSVIINQYKSSVKRWCNKNGHPDFEWQSRFHDHIIRDERSYWTISEYIAMNPSKWNEDKFYNG